MARPEPASVRTATVRPDRQTRYTAQARKLVFMLLDGVNHVALLTNDTDRLHAFYREIFDATVSRDNEVAPGVRLSFVDIGPNTELNVFQVDGNAEAQRQTPMFGRGRIDHLGFQAASLDAFIEIRRRLIAIAASDGFVTDFGPVLSIFFRDPDGLEGEVCVANPDTQPGAFNPPGTRSSRFS
jgi:catechol 2,3-dioxygenase-like lactoylglutathione lyase family enzyme